jgi:hypothetical protein
MTTRIFLPASGAAAVNPAFDGAWEKTADADRLECVTVRINSGFASKTSSENAAASPYDFLTRQYVSKPLAAQDISGTVKGQVKCLESSSQADFCRALVVKVVSPDGQTLRGTLVSHFPGALASEYSSTGLTNRYFPPAGTPLTPVTVQAGDRLVIEVGTRSFNTSSTNRTATHRFGDASVTDLPENESETQDYNPWLEFSQTLTFLSFTGAGAGAAAPAGATALGRHGVQGPGGGLVSSPAPEAAAGHGVAGTAGADAPGGSATASGWAAVTGSGAAGPPSCLMEAPGKHGATGTGAATPDPPGGVVGGSHGVAGAAWLQAADLWAAAAGVYSLPGSTGTGAAEPLGPAASAGGNFSICWFGLGAAAGPAMAAGGLGLTGSGQPGSMRLRVVRELRELRRPGETRTLTRPGESRVLKARGQVRTLAVAAEERILRRVA